MMLGLGGGEGLNLQFWHVVINYDIPWNPMRLEQRIGRVDRIGQAHTVRAVNFVFEGSVERRAHIARERQKANHAFAVRRRMIERIGLPEVPNYRLNLLAQEENVFHEQLDRKIRAFPEMMPLLILRVEGGA
jgi:superfamily II DNA/RNA helicase